MAKRLNVFVARATGLSRRAADRAVEEGRVKIDGETVLEPGTNVESGDEVTFDGRPIESPEEFVWLLMNKPEGYITTRSDESGRQTVMDLLPEHLHRLFPVGRLDRDTEGVLLFTNDGKAAHRMLHPSHGVERTYRVWLDNRLSDRELDLVRKGVLLDSKRAVPLELKMIGKIQPIYEITLTEGRYHEVKRIFSALGRDVLKLERLSHAGISAGKLKPGEWRILEKKEIENLKSRLKRKIESNSRT